MYILDTRHLEEWIARGALPAGELSLFLEEWLDAKPYVVGHTSGSTGKPKEIRLNKADMRASARITNERLGIGPDAVLLLCLSVSYIAGKMMVVRALEAGAELWVVPPGTHPLREVDWQDGRKVDLAAMVPMQVEESLKTEGQAFLNIRQLLVGGAPVASQLEEKLGGLPTACYATYGMTETVSHVALRKIGQDAYYTALGEVAFGKDERECLVITAPHLQEGCFVTNDVVELLDRRHFKWLGRWDNVINSGGLKFFPELIEEKIAALFRGRFFITSQPDERLGEKIVLVVEGELPLPQEQLNEELRKILAKYEVPREIAILPRFYETDSGKVIRRLDRPAASNL